jgi:hypothetical protein
MKVRQWRIIIRQFKMIRSSETIVLMSILFFARGLRPGMILLVPSQSLILLQELLQSQKNWISISQWTIFSCRRLMILNSIQPSSQKKARFSLLRRSFLCSQDPRSLKISRVLIHSAEHRRFLPSRSLMDIKAAFKIVLQKDKRSWKGKRVLNIAIYKKMTWYLSMLWRS